jgi:hypothetical protein
MKYVYVYGKDYFDDDNNGLLYGVQDNTDFPEYVEWFKSPKIVIAYAKKNKLNVINEKAYLKRMKEIGVKIK